MSTETPPRLSGTAHVPELDGIRGVAIALVMALHFLCTPLEGPQNLAERAVVRITGYGVWGVDLFFVLSGYLITGILADSKGALHYFRTFYMRRTLRIFPLYYGVLLVAAVLVPSSLLAIYAPKVLQMRAAQAWFWPYLTNVYLTKTGSFSIPYFSHFWTLAIEEHFYLAWPFVVGLTRRETAMRVCIGLGVLALASRIALHLGGQAFAAQVLTPCRLDTLTIGAWFALAARGPGGIDALAARTRAWIAPLALGVIALSAVHVARLRIDPIVEPVRLSTLSVFFGAFILMSAWRGGPVLLRALLRQRWLRMLGRYSYGLYVYHGIVAYALCYDGLLVPIQAALGSRLGGVIVGAVIGSALSIILAVLSYELYETRFLGLKRLFQTTREPHREPAPAPEGPGGVG
jgi:peptidoglycan/LPS O-acetylase OafA/YrhL